jgi:hypothetical protein
MRNGTPRRQKRCPNCDRWIVAGHLRRHYEACIKTDDQRERERFVRRLTRMRERQP